MAFNYFSTDLAVIFLYLSFCGTLSPINSDSRQEESSKLDYINASVTANTLEPLMELLWKYGNPEEQ